MVELSDAELRVLGALIEKEATTPEYYPLSTNALVNACNQTSNRNPIVTYSDSDVDQVLKGLREAGFARVGKGVGERSYKHRHVLNEKWGLTSAELAALAIMMLRGPQTLNELKTRTERYAVFDSVEELQATLMELAERADPFVRCEERQPGQKEQRWRHLLGGSEPEMSSGPHSVHTSGEGYALSPTAQRITDLESQVAQLTTWVQQLAAELGFELTKEGET